MPCNMLTMLHILLDMPVADPLRTRTIPVYPLFLQSSTRHPAGKFCLARGRFYFPHAIFSFFLGPALFTE